LFCRARRVKISLAREVIHPCPGRGAAFFTVQRRAGTHAGAPPGFSSAPHRASKTRVNALTVLRCIRGTL
jgi:hypothetical protein